MSKSLYRAGQHQTLMKAESITAAVTAKVYPVTTIVDAPTAFWLPPNTVMLTALCSLTYVASAATSLKVYLQTTFDGEDTWMDFACFAFTTASAAKIMSISALTAALTPATPAEATLADNTAIAYIGDRVRVKVTSVGTYGAGNVVDLDIVTKAHTNIL